ncbi:hypothetical protein [Shewanella gaetbuli]
MIAILLHTLVLLFIQLTWTNTPNTELKRNQANVAALKSYLITEHQYQQWFNKPLVEDSLIKEDEGNDAAVHKSSVKQSEFSKAVDSKPIVKNTNLQANTQQKKQLTPNGELEQSAIISNKTPIKPQESDKDIADNKLVPQRNSQQKSTSINQASKQYLSNNQSQLFEAMVQNQHADANKPVGSMSVMDPELEFIEIEQATDPQQIHTFNHRLDPNRIVKQGDYCYKVVKLATQINPHAWNYGFAEFCGEDEIQQALDSSISFRVNKIKP